MKKKFNVRRSNLFEVFNYMVGFFELVVHEHPSFQVVFTSVLFYSCFVNIRAN